MAGSVTEVKSLAQWKELLPAGSGACVAFFWADWHEPSKVGGQMDAVMEHLAHAHGPRVSFLRVEAEAVPDVALRCNIAVVPTFLFLLGGGESCHVVDRLEGAHPAQLATKLQALVALPTPPHTTTHSVSSSSSAAKPSATSATAVTTTSSATNADLNERLRSLISAGQVVLFMKGSPSEPKCGFSRTMVGLLTEAGVSFVTFDILKDDAVRQGLKAYSQWPTYPQLYVKGELIGGLDILKEMAHDTSTTLKAQLGLSDLEEEEMEGPTKDKASSDKEKENEEEEPLEGRLKRLTTMAPVVLFMKGDASAPRCGFSSTMVGLLEGEGVSFVTFDILEEDTVRQGLKAYSQWPTYPQLYVKGELVGGLDIVKEMVATGGQGSLREQLGLTDTPPHAEA